MITQKAMVNLEIVKGERKYIFLIESGAPLGECYDACHEMLQEIMKLSQEAVEKVKPVAEEDNGAK